MRILIVDDETNIRRTLRIALEAFGHEVDEAEDSNSAIDRVARAQPYDVALVDLKLGRESGLDLTDKLIEANPRLAVVLITAYSSLETAIEAIRRGAFDYLPKPFTPAQVRVVLDRAERVRGLSNRVAELEERVRSAGRGDEPESTDPAMRRVAELAKKVSPTDAVVLIRGESGTGKGLLARSIHAWSKRADGPFVTVSAPSLNPGVLESELFGHSKGSFTGADRDVAGKVAAAEGGTLFLDEIGELPASLQPKLLRFVQDREYERVGEVATRRANVRILAATNRDLEAAVGSGAFREDLLYRLNVVELVLPPLRLRTDLNDLADRLLDFFASQTGRRFSGFSTEAREAMNRHSWPGNIRELRNAIERAAILSAGPEISATDLPDRMASSPNRESGSLEIGGRLRLDHLEAEHIRRVLDRASSLDEAAQILGIDPSTLFRKRKKLGL